MIWNWMRRAVQNRSFPQAPFRVVNKPVASELWGHVGTLYPPSSGLVPPVPPSQRCGLCQNFKQTTLTTRLCKVSTNLYPPLTKNFRRAWNKLSESRLISSAQCKELLYIHFILHMVDFLSPLFVTYSSSDRQSTRSWSKIALFRDAFMLQNADSFHYFCCRRWYTKLTIWTDALRMATHLALCNILKFSIFLL